MTLDFIKELVERRKNKLEKSYEKDERYNICKEFLDNNTIIVSNPISTARDFLKIDIWEFLKCIYLVDPYLISMEDKLNNFDMFKDIVQFLNSGEVGDLQDEFRASKFQSGEVIRMLERKELSAGEISDVLYGSANNVVSSEVLEIMKKEKNIASVDILTKYECFEKMGDSFEELITLYKIYIRLVEFNQEKEAGNSERYDFFAKNMFSSGSLKFFLGQIQKFVRNEEKAEEQLLKNNQREINNLNMLIRNLEREVKKEEIFNVRGIVKGIKDLRIKYSVLEFIEDHNNSYYDKLDREYEYLNRNTKIKYQALLDDYGISKEMYHVSSIIHNSVDDVEMMLSVIGKFIDNKRSIVDVLKNSNLEIVNEIKKYIDREYISIEFINDNIDMFYINSFKLDNYNKNIELLNSYGINPNLFINSIQVLISDIELVSSNLELLRSYILLNSIKTTSDYSFLLDSELYLKIDKLIELNYEEFLKTDLGILNSSNLKRLDVLKSINMEVDSKEEFDDILNKRFFINDLELDDYIINVSDYHDEVDLDIAINDLYRYRSTPRSYSIGGVIISINKVRRIYSENNSMYEAIIGNMNLSENEYNSIMNELCGLCKNN